MIGYVYTDEETLTLNMRDQIIPVQHVVNIMVADAPTPSVARTSASMTLIL